MFRNGFTILNSFRPICKRFFRRTFSVSVQNHSVIELRGSVSDLHNTVNDLNDSVDDLYGSGNALNGSVDNLHHSVNHLRSSVGRLRDSVSHLRSSVGRLRSSVSRLHTVGRNLHGLCSDDAGVDCGVDIPAADDETYLFARESLFVDQDRS